MVSVGIDIGGTGIQVGVVDGEGRIIAKRSIVTRLDIPFSEQIAQMAQCVLDTHCDADMPLSEVSSIGAGIPGIADPKTGVIPFCTNLRWHNVPFREEFHKHIDKPLFIDNDATVAALA